MSYEMAAELCNLSVKTIGNIACRKSIPSIASLEKLCAGFGKTPNELLTNTDGQEAIAYRLPGAEPPGEFWKNNIDIDIY